MGTVCVSTLPKDRAAGLVWGSCLRTLSPQELCVSMGVCACAGQGGGWLEGLFFKSIALQFHLLHGEERH